MKKLLLVMVATTALAGVAPAARAEKESPFACDRLALTPAERSRHFDVLGPLLRQRKLAVRELSEGYEFRFPSDPETIRLVTEWVVGERRCCPFFDIDLRLEREGGAFWMRLTGRPGTKEFIQTEGATWIRS